MNSQRRILIGIVLVAGFGLVGFCWLSTGNAAEISTNEYEISVPAMKTDTQRLIEAYERLSDQYLSLVQSQLVGMAAADRDIMTRLDRIERKLDDLSTKVDTLLKPAPAPAPLPAAPSQAPAAKEDTGNKILEIK
jgi:hypothetical protein